jgi:hypothetical protein
MGDERRDTIMADRPKFKAKKSSKPKKPKKPRGSGSKGNAWRAYVGGGRAPSDAPLDW